MSLRKLVRAAVAAVAAACAVVLIPAQSEAAEYSSALKLRGVQYDAPGRDSNSCSSGNTDEEYVTIKNYSSSVTVNLRNYVVRDAAGNRFVFPADHYLQPGDYVRLRGGNGTDSDKYNVVYRDNCNFMWNNDRDTIYLYKPSGSAADSHSYTKSGSDPDGNGYVSFHG
ncbi:lamin tail domain-containing protein [Streptomyces sp. URMC 129]|uniref:lamin tail domain-containing protein n=1 Tax=Streptomyces sp. URMC 129 TaxID=3423407 RepID=UPI003F1A4977